MYTIFGLLLRNISNIFSPLQKGSMTKTIQIILAVCLVAACSSQKTVQKVEEKSFHMTRGDSLQVAEKAQEFFIKGTTLDLKGNYAEAILEYQTALEYLNSPGIHYALGKDYLILSKLPQALKHTRKAIQSDSTNTDYLSLLGNIYSFAHQEDSAALVYRKIISIDSTNYQAYFNLGSLWELQKPLQALSVYEKLLEKTGPQWNVLVRIAEINERLGNVDKTISTVEELLVLNPSNIQLRKLLVESYLKTNRTEDALTQLDDLLTTFPNDLELIEYRANALLKLDKWEEGLGEYLKLVKSDEINFEGKKQIASAFFAEASRDSSKIDLVKQVVNEIEKDSTDWQLKAISGEIASLENNDSLAIEYFSDASSKAEWNQQVWNRLGILLFESQRYEEAVEKMTKATSLFPDDFILNVILGLSLSQQNKSSEAEPVLKKAVQLNPNDITALHAYGFTLNQLDKIDEAIIYLEQALSIDSNNVDVMGTLGLIYDNKKDWEKSDEIYEMAISIDSSNALILNNYAYSLAERGEKLNFALEMSKKALEADPESSSYLDTIGWIYYKLGDYEKAKNYIEKAFEKDSDNATLSDHLGDVYDKLGDKSKAVGYWEKALELDPSLDNIKEKIKKAAS